MFGGNQCPKCEGQLGQSWWVTLAGHPFGDSEATATYVSNMGDCGTKRLSESPNLFQLVFRHSLSHPVASALPCLWLSTVRWESRDSRQLVPWNIVPWHNFPHLVCLRAQLFHLRTLCCSLLLHDEGWPSPQTVLSVPSKHRDKLLHLVQRWIRSQLRGFTCICP